ncbi:MAG: GntP family permease [Planctomycetaceae bacterium]
MSPLLILLVGLVTVIGCILVLRLHAFLALVLGALVVGMLTPPEAVLQFHIGADSRRVLERADQWTIEGSKSDVALTEQLVAIEGFGESRTVTKLDQTADGESIKVVKVNGTEFSDDAKIVSLSSYNAALTASKSSIFGRLTSGLGSTCGKIGLLIAFASIIGYCLHSSGAAERIVTSMLKITGERGAPIGFMLSGFLLGIPVFFDTVFYLMIPLGQALHRKTGRSYLMYVLSIVAGATMAHSLVPPTPGPLFVAEQLQVDIGVMMVGGSLVGLATLLVGYAWAMFITRNGELQLPADAEPIASPDRKLPPLALSLAPILIPVALISLPLTLKATGSSLGASVDQILGTLGNKNTALAIAAAFAILLAKLYRTDEQAALSSSLENALSSAGIIILITSAGGAFGAMLRSSGLSLAGLVEEGATPVMLVTLAFVATTVIRTAQGSATVAMMTAVGIFGPLVGGELGFHPIYLALAIGAGSKPIAWMNDSGFWVITRMSGMTESQGLRYVTPMTALMGAAALGLLLVGVTYFPNPI